MQVQHRRRDVRLGQHIVDLAAMVRLVVKEVCHQYNYRIDVYVTLVVRVPDLPFEEPLV